MSYVAQRGVIAVFLFALAFAPVASVHAADTDYERYSLSFFARTNSDSEGTDEFECSYGEHETYEDGDFTSESHDTCRVQEEEGPAHEEGSIFDHYFNLIYAQFEQSQNGDSSSSSEESSEYEEESSTSDDEPLGGPIIEGIRDSIESNSAFDRLQSLFD